MQIKEVVDKEVEQLKDRDDVRAVLIVGSYARNKQTTHNDVDLFVVIEGNWRKRKTENIEGFVVEKFFNSERWVEKYLEEREWWKNYHWFDNAEVRYDPENLIDSFREQIEERKEEYINSEIKEEEIKYNIWDFKQDIKTKDVGQKRFMMYKLLDYLIDQQYRLKKQIPVKENYKVENLKNFDGYMYKLTQEFLTHSSTMKKEEILEKIIEHVTREIGKPNPLWETDKEEL